MIDLLKRLSRTAALALALGGLSCSNSPSSPSTSSTTTTTAASTGPAPQVTLSPAALSFATQTFGSPPMTQAVVVSNSGTDTLVISSVSAFGNFTETDNCISSFAVGEACTINVTFANMSAGAAGGVTITDNASTSPQTVTITGPTVTAPSGILSPSSLLFA